MMRGLGMRGSYFVLTSETEIREKFAKARPLIASIAQYAKTPINFAVGAIGQDIGSRSRAAVRDRVHRVVRRVCVIT
jgi:hypothetical protein